MSEHPILNIYVYLEADPRNGLFSYHASVEELPGCVTQGNDVPQTLENLADAIRGVLQVMHEDGDSPRWDRCFATTSTNPKVAIKVAIRGSSG